jgi:hypothetical protein
MNPTAPAIVPSLARNGSLRFLNSQHALPGAFLLDKNYAIRTPLMV